MIYDDNASRSTGEESVRLVAFGHTAARFVERLCNQAPAPLISLFKDQTAWIQLNGSLIDTPLMGLAILFIVIGADATAQDLNGAMDIASRSSQYNASTIGVFVQPEAKDAGFRRSRPPAIAATLVSALMDVVDGTVDVHGRQWTEQQEALCWLATTLRRLHEKGLVILEPAWDLNDLLETLDLPGASLLLVTRTVRPGDVAHAAVELALQDLRESGEALELANGLLVILWQSNQRRLRVSEVREAGQMANQALSKGGLHMVLVAQAGAEWEGVGACATLVISWRRCFPKLGGVS